MNRRVLSVSRCLIPAFVTACLATGSHAQQGPPTRDVNIANTPLPVTGSVTLAPGASVNVNSSVANPVRVRSVNDAIQPVQASVSCTSPSNTIGCGPATIYTVPTGKRLVIEYASMDACLLPGQTVELSIYTTLGSAFTRHYVNISPPAAGPGVTNIGCNLPAASSITTVGQALRLYADAGTTVDVEGDRNAIAGSANLHFTISGYLVDVPLN